MDVNIAANTASTEAINSTAKAISTFPDTAVTSAYATATPGNFEILSHHNELDLCRLFLNYIIV